MRTILPGVAIIVLLAASGHAVDITGCDQEVPAGEVGVLTTDLDCRWLTGDYSYAVELHNRATLLMQGHTIMGPRYAVYCTGRCTITGPGTITGAYYGIWAFDRRSSRADISDVTLTGNLGSMAVVRGKLTNVTTSNHMIGLDVKRLRGTNITVSGCTDTLGNPYCVETENARIDGLTVTDSASTYAAVFVERRLRLTNASITGNTSPNGVYSTRGGTRIENSTVTGHDIDLLTDRRPVVIDTVCGTSAKFGGSFPTWGVCPND